MQEETLMLFALYYMTDIAQTWLTNDS